MSTRDAGFLYLERPNAPLHLGCILRLEERIDREQLAWRIESRLHRLRRYAQRALEVPLSVGHPIWEDDPDFEVRRHLHRWTLPAPGGDAELMELCAELLMNPLQRSRPLWEMHVIDGLADGGCAVLQKVHHCMIDGMAGAELLDVLLDREPKPVDPSSAPARAHDLPAAGARIGDALRERVVRGARLSANVFGTLTRPAAARAAVTRLRDTAWSALRLATDDVPELPWNTPLGPRRRLGFTRLPAEGVERVRRARGGSVNDVVLCVLAGALRRYLEATGVSARDLELTALVPVSLRSPHQARALGNRVSAMLVPLAVDLADEVPRFAATRGIAYRLERDSAWVGIDGLLSMLDELPPAMVALAARQLRLGSLANLVCTRVPGPEAIRYLCGSPVRDLLPLVPIVDGIGLGIAVLCYAGQLFVGVNADAASVPDLDKLVLGMEDAFEALVRA